MVKISETATAYDQLEFQGTYTGYKFKNENIYDLVSENKTLWITLSKTEDKICSIKSKSIKYQDFNNGIIFWYKTKNDRKDTMLLQFFEVENPKALEMKEIIKVYNKSKSYFEPLTLDYSSQERVSWLSSESEKPANLRGFMNLLVMIMFAQNTSLILVNINKYGKAIYS